MNISWLSCVIMMSYLFNFADSDSVEYNHHRKRIYAYRDNLFGIEESSEDGPYDTKGIDNGANRNERQINNGTHGIKKKKKHKRKHKHRTYKTEERNRYHGKSKNKKGIKPELVSEYFNKTDLKAEFADTGYRTGNDKIVLGNYENKTNIKVEYSDTDYTTKNEKFAVSKDGKKTNFFTGYEDTDALLENEENVQTDEENKTYLNAEYADADDKMENDKINFIVEENTTDYEESDYKLDKNNFVFTTSENKRNLRAEYEDTDYKIAKVKNLYNNDKNKTSFKAHYADTGYKQKNDNVVFRTHESKPNLSVEYEDTDTGRDIDDKIENEKTASKEENNTSLREYADLDYKIDNGRIVLRNYHHNVKNEINSNEESRRGNFANAVTGIRPCRKLRFLKEDNAEVIALVSYRGSGISWLRSMLQQATGIYTGSRIKNEPAPSARSDLLFNRTANVLLVQQDFGPQEPSGQAKRNSKCVMLIRNPKDTLMAAFNYRYPVQSEFPKATSFQRPEWSTFVATEIVKWANLYKTTLKWRGGPVHIVFYELLIHDTIKTLEKVLDFLKQTYTQSDLKCVRNFSYHSMFKTRGKYNFNPYSSKQEDLVHLYAMQTLDEIRRYQEKHAADGWV